MRTDPASLRSAPVAGAIRDARLIAVLRRVEPRARLLALVGDLLAAGIRIFEVTFDGPEPAGELAAVREHLATARESRTNQPSYVGAGTVRTLDHVEAAVRAGADFGVSPVLDEAILGAALSAGLPFVPGAYSPTEADRAWRLGATFVKLFPGSSLGPNHVREMHGPLPEIEVIVTGGVDAGNAGELIAAGAVAVGVGSALARMTGTERAALLQAVRSAR